MAVKTAVHAAINKHENMTECKSVACIADCSRKAGCFRKEIREKCLAVKNESQVCDIDCDEPSRALAPLGTTFLLAAGVVIAANSIG